VAGILLVTHNGLGDSFVDCVRHVLGEVPPNLKVLSVLAGDVYGNTPVHGRLLVFKVIYYAASLLNPRRTLKAWRVRKNNIRVVDEAGAAVN